MAQWVSGNAGRVYCSQPPIDDGKVNSRRPRMVYPQAAGYLSYVQTLHQTALVDGSPDKAREQRVRLERARLQFGMELYADEPGMVGVLDRLR